MFCASNSLPRGSSAATPFFTAGGRQYTYTAGRNDTTGHADLAWALFHALHNEPLEGQTAANTGRMEIF